MDLEAAIVGRRSVRNYSSHPVEKEILMKLFSAATYAPSATNSQPWAFAVITDTALLKDLSTRAKSLLIESMREHPWLEKYRAALTNPDYNIFYNAPTLLIIYAKPEGPYPFLNCALAAENLMLAAHAYGLGTCWIGFAQPLLDQPELKREFGVPSEYQAVAPIVVGYPQGQTPPIPRKKPEIIFWRA